MLEQMGWRQGSVFVADSDSKICRLAGIDPEPSSFLVAVSHSCDIARVRETEPTVEFLLATQVQKPEYQFNNHPRYLDVEITKSEIRSNNVSESIFIRFSSHEKITIDKQELEAEKIAPNQNYALENSHVISLVDWIVRRYKRPALPSDFEKAIAKKKGKLREKAKKFNSDISAVYISIESDHGTFKVNLLGLLSERSNRSREDIDRSFSAWSAVLSDLGMTVVAAVRARNEVNVARLDKMQRFDYDNLSYRDDEELPPDVM